jgi:hypothetical protein
MFVPFGLLGYGTFDWNGTVATTFAQRLPLLAGFAAQSAFLGAVAIGYWRERRWARPLAPLFWLLLALYLKVSTASTSTDPAGDWLVAGMLVAIGCLTAWYFYRKRSVVTYYRALEGKALTQPSAGAGA